MTHDPLIYRHRLPERRCALLAALIVFVLPGPESLLAQVPADADIGSELLDEVIVMARRVEENVQEVPMSVQVLSAELLDELKLSRLVDLQYNVPGMVVNNMGLNGAGFSLRGVANQGGDLSAATYLNGVYLGNSNLVVARLFDIERIEVLKGPQGTLYGRNATGGSINLVTRAPEDHFGADIEVAYGSFDTLRVQGELNLPVDKAALRLAFIGSGGDGFIRNSVDARRFAEQDFWGLRATMSIDAGDRSRFDVMAQRVEEDGGAGDVWLPRPDFLADPSDIRLTTVTLANPFLDTVNDNISLSIEFDLGFTLLRSITGYARNETRNVDDCAGVFPLLQGCVRSVSPSKHRQWSQEFHFVSQDNTGFDWLLGAYAYGADTSIKYFQFTPFIDPNPTDNRTTVSEETTYAIFAQATRAFGESWSITAGLRLNDERHRKSTIGTGTEDSPTLIAAEIDANNPSWRLDVKRDLTDDLLVYAGVSTGVKSGGLTNLPGGVLDTFGPEELIAYEAGVKSEWLDRRATLNAAAFLYDFRDLQVSTWTITANGLMFETDNAAKAEIYGIESEGAFHVSEGLRISGGLTWLPMREFVEYRNDRTGDTLSGNQLTRAPEWTATASIDHDFRLPGRGKLATRLEYHYRSGYFYTTDNNPRFAQSSFSLLNIFLSYESLDERWYVFASGRNLGDEDYFNQVFLQSSPGYPDTYELGAGYRF